MPRWQAAYSVGVPRELPRESIAARQTAVRVLAGEPAPDPLDQPFLDPRDRFRLAHRAAAFFSGRGHANIIVGLQPDRSTIVNDRGTDVRCRPLCNENCVPQLKQELQT